MTIPANYLFICEKIEKLRKLHGFSQEYLGEKIGLTGSYISQLERGLISPSLQTLISLSKVFNLTLSELVTDDTKIKKYGIKENFITKEKPVTFIEGVKLYFLIKDHEKLFEFAYTVFQDKTIINNFDFLPKKLIITIFMLTGKLQITMLNNKNIELNSFEKATFLSTDLKKCINLNQGDTVALCLLHFED